MKITNPKGLSLDALLVTPPSMRAGVVLCHGFLSTKDNETNMAIIDKLASSNIGAFAFDFTGHGKSEGNPIDITLKDLYGDVIAAVSYAKPLFPNKIGLYGASLGGAMCVLYAMNGGIDALALKCPLVDPVKSWDNYQKTKISFGAPLSTMIASKITRMMAGTRPLYETAALLSMPAMIVAADGDELVDVEDIVKLSLAIGAKECTILPGDHDFSQKEYHEKMVTLVSDWFGKTLV